MSTRSAAPSRKHHSQSDSPIVPTAPFDHVVQFYEQGTFLIEAIGRYVHPTLVAGGAAVVVATKPHREALAEELLARGFDPKVAAGQSRYLVLDAAVLLGQFMMEGWPNETLFKKIIGQVIERAKGKGHRLAVFGEMVALLWADGKHDAAVRLERLWNELAEAEAFSLLCAFVP